MSRLQDMITKASQEYYSTGKSPISDDKFDAMLDQLKKEDPNSSLLTDVGHGYNIETDTTPGQKVKHRYGPAGSLTKCHNWKEYKLQLKPLSSEVSASLKLDGLSIVLYYENGQLVRALTRGSGAGEIGIDITHKVSKIDSSLLTTRSDAKFTGAVRGEIIMSYSNFDTFKQIHPEAKNARNSAVGLINAIEISQELSLLNVVVYNVVGCSTACYEDNGCFDSYMETMLWLSDNFKHVAPAQKVNLSEAEFTDIMDDLNTQWYGKYPADGIVLTDQVHHSFLNNTDVSFTFDAIAFKYKANVINSTVTNVEWNLSKSKYLVPRVNFETVEIEGTSVSWAHGDNAKNILEQGIAPGAEIEVCKRGLIIPHIESVIRPAKVELPETCPCCGTKLIWDGVHLACPNTSTCTDSHVKDLLIWSSWISPYFGLGDLLKLKFFEGWFGENISIEAVYNRGNVTYSESSSIKFNDFQKMYIGLFTNKVELDVAIKALNIPRLGEVNAAKLANYSDIVNQLMQTGQSVEFTSQEIKDIGPANCNAINESSQKFTRLKFIESQINWKQIRLDDTPIRGKVVITGSLSMKRKEFEQVLKSNGFQVQSAVTKDTSYLITNTPESGSSKNIQAEKLNVPRITESDFMKLLK